ncbi:MAG TPA: hypothetical protein VK843_13575 [Planctomycetota bacterium]|nr:hypothetical protein [Planctomycetota bacterium]
MAIARFALCAVLAFQVPAPKPAPAPESPPSLVARIAVIGASASAGYKLHVTLADALDAQLAAVHDAPKCFATETLFLEPLSIGEEQVARAAAIAPTLVVAADFLFWFGYGEVSGGEPERLANLDLGLELLDGITCPLIVSHFPDMTPAVGKMLMASQMPKQETLAKLDARLDVWAAKRGHVAFVQMPEMLVRLRLEELLTVGGVEFKGPASKRRLIQSDELHPTAEGLGVLARLCIDAACGPTVGAKPAEFRLELSPVLDSLRELDESRAKALRGESQPNR